MPPLHSLRTFEAAARLRSFKKAAEELNVTPAAVSHQITQLENFLGVQLFERMHRAIALTPVAKQSMTLLSSGFADLRQAVLQMGMAPSVPLTVSCPPSFAHRWLLPKLYSFVSMHPDIDIQVTTELETARDVQKRSANAEIRMIELVESYDIVITLGRASSYSVTTESLLSLDITPLCSPSLCGKQQRADVTFLQSTPLLHDDRGALYNEADFWTLWLRAAGYDETIAADGQRFSHSFLALDAAVDARGIVATTPALAEAEIRTGRLVVPFDLRVPIEQGYRFAVHPSKAQETNVAIFADWLRSAILPSKAAASNCVKSI